MSENSKMPEKKKTTILIVSIIAGSILVTVLFVFILWTVKSKIKPAIDSLVQADVMQTEESMQADSDDDIIKNDTDESNNNGSTDQYVSKYDHSNPIRVSDHIDIVDIPRHIDISEYTVDYYPEYDYVSDEDGYHFYWKDDGMFNDDYSVRTENLAEGRVSVREIISNNGAINVDYINGVFEYASYEVYSDDWDILFFALYDINGDLQSVQIMMTRYYDWGYCQQQESYWGDGDMVLHYYHCDNNGDLLEETNERH